MNPSVRYVSIRIEIEGKRTPDELREIVDRMQRAVLRAGASEVTVLDPAPEALRLAKTEPRATRAPSRRMVR